MTAATAPSAGEVEVERAGAFSWVATVDHKRIGTLYLVTALFFFAIGGVESLAIRLQLARPGLKLLSPDTFNQTFTMHGTTMIFLVVMPTLVGIGNYFLPLMIGARDMAFPRLNALSYWLFPFGGLLLHFSLLAGGAPAAGWFSYTPLSETPFNSTTGTDYWVLALLILGVGSVATAINFIATVATLRAPGLTMRRLPLFVWMTFINAFVIILALPVLNASIIMLLIDRQLDAHFFMPHGGGSPILWQHFFWAFGHPEVYIMALPAFGIISEVIPVFSRKSIFGYELLSASTVAIAILSLSVWAHHMFTAGLGFGANVAFGASSMLIAVPTGVKIFNWIATMWGGTLRLTTAMSFAVAFLLEFVIGGITGIMFAAPPVDWQLTDTYFVVAHFHYVLFGGTAFGIFAGIYYWFPKMTGRMLSERWGMVHFWLTVIGFNVTFFVQHFLGLMGMPRRVFTYPDLPGWGALNMVSTIGAFVLGLAVLVFLANIANSLSRGKLAGDNPWDGWTLEWATTSPPPPHNFDLVPPVRGRRPLWDLANPPKSAEVTGPHAPADLPTQQAKAEVIPPDKNVVGMWSFIVSESGFFLILIIAYVVFNMSTEASAAHLDVARTSVFTLCLFASSFTIHRCGKALAGGREGAFRSWLVATIVLGIVFLSGQLREYYTLLTGGLRVNSSLFATTFFTLTGFHGLHVTVGLVALLVLLGLAISGGVGGRYSSAVKAMSLYWHFVDVVWVAVFSVVYLRSLL
jgi:cytochrome c oxidase subunit 1/cytochrome c oxidase subunit I+III